MAQTSKCMYIHVARAALMYSRDGVGVGMDCELLKSHLPTAIQCQFAYPCREHEVR